MDLAQHVHNMFYTFLLLYGLQIINNDNIYTILYNILLFYLFIEFVY